MQPFVPGGTKGCIAGGRSRWGTARHPSIGASCSNCACAGNRLSGENGTGGKPIRPDNRICHQRFLARHEDRAVPIPLSRTRGCLSPPLRESEDGPGGICARLRKRVDPRGVREAQDQMRRVPPPTVSCGHGYRDSLASLRARRARSRFRDGDLSDAAGRDLLLPGGGFRPGAVAGGCGCVPRDLPGSGSGGCSGAIPIRQWGACLDVF